MSVRIAPSILSTDLGRLAEQVRQAEEGGADWLHVDVMDGRFVPNLTFGAPVVTALRKISELPIDVHLMVERPEHYIRNTPTSASPYSPSIPRRRITCNGTWRRSGNAE